MPNTKKIDWTALGSALIGAAAAIAGSIFMGQYQIEASREAAIETAKATYKATQETNSTALKVAEFAAKTSLDAIDKQSQSKAEQESRKEQKELSAYIVLLKANIESCIDVLDSYTEDLEHIKALFDKYGPDSYTFFKYRTNTLSERIPTSYLPTSNHTAALLGTEQLKKIITFQNQIKLLIRHLNKVNNKDTKDAFNLTNKFKASLLGFPDTQLPALEQDFVIFASKSIEPIQKNLVFYILTELKLETLQSIRYGLKYLISSKPTKDIPPKSINKMKTRLAACEINAIKANYDAVQYAKRGMKFKMELTAKLNKIKDQVLKKKIENILDINRLSIPK